MKKLASAALIGLAAMYTPVHAALNEGGFNYDKNQLDDPWVRNVVIENCSHGAITQPVQEKLAKLMRVPEADVRFQFCRRIITAYALGTLAYADYVQLKTNHLFTPAMAKALQFQGSVPAANHSGQGQADVVLPVVARMDSGETFKGETVASRSGGHFSVQSSRHSVKCFGTYNPKDPRLTVTLSVKCSDGRVGQAEVTTTADHMSGTGKVKFSDGSTGRVRIGNVGKQS
jgi:hypothetical protein